MAPPTSDPKAGGSPHPTRRLRGATCRFALLVALAAADVRAEPRPLRPKPLPTASFRTSGWPAIRGMTLGPVENSLHPGVGYGTAACGRALDRVVAMGGTWVAFTPFGRVWSTRTAAVDWSFEASFEDNRLAITRAIQQAHSRGLHVMLVPHLWLERGDWRGEIEPLAGADVKKPDGGYIYQARASEAALRSFASSYRRFVTAWAQVAEHEAVEMFSVGVELRSWVTSGRALPELRATMAEVRRRYHGLLTYSSNWDDAEDAVMLRDVDVLGLNAFYPLADEPGASPEQLREGGRRVRAKVATLARTWGKPVIFTEVGYTARPNPAVRPWEWPDRFTGVKVDLEAQAEAYRAILTDVLDEESFGGFFVWRQFSDPDDVSQEPPWGFPVFDRPAEKIVRDVFATRWASDPPSPDWTVLGRGAQGVPGAYWQFPALDTADLPASHSDAP